MLVYNSSMMGVNGWGSVRDRGSMSDGSVGNVRCRTIDGNIKGSCASWGLVEEGTFLTAGSSSMLSKVSGFSGSYLRSVWDSTSGRLVP